MTTMRVPFTVSARPRGEPTDQSAQPPSLPVLARTTFDKTFDAEPLVGTSVVEMVSAAAGSGPLAYVALERVEGTLDGRSGAFVLQHVGTVVDGVPSLDLRVVAGSGTGDLVGLSGRGTIEHADALAHLELSYELPP